MDKIMAEHTQGCDLVINEVVESHEVSAGGRWQDPVELVAVHESLFGNHSHPKRKDNGGTMIQHHFP